MSYSTRDSALEKQGSNHISNQSQSKLATQFADNRSTTAAQLQQQTRMASSPAIIAQRAMMETMASSSVQQQKAIQRAAPEEELLQGKFTVQRAEEEELLQGKFETAQRVEDEQLLQGKFTVQRAEEEEILQGKFATVQRAEEEELLQGKFETAQRVEEEEPLQGKYEPVQRAEDEALLQAKFTASTLLQREEKSAQQPNNTGLPDQLKSGIESLSGMSMDHVKVHYNSSQPAQLNAHAYAQGSDIHVAPGQEQHLPHEAWHVVQQAQGRVKPTMQMNAGVPVNDDVGLESEADVMGAKALGIGESAVQKMGDDNIQLKSISSSAPIAQRLVAQLLIGRIDGSLKAAKGKRRKEYSEIQRSCNDMRALMDEAETLAINTITESEETPLLRDDAGIETKRAQLLTKLNLARGASFTINAQKPTVGLPADAGVQETLSHYENVWLRMIQNAVLTIQENLHSLGDSLSDRELDVDDLADGRVGLFAAGKLTLTGGVRRYGGANSGEAYYFNETKEWTLHIHRSKSSAPNSAHFKPMSEEVSLGYNALNRVSDTSLIKLGIYR